ncbi:MAG: quinone oxidoreductase [Gammaproteobacteria bacterium]|nr:quinone oxidoreductase [Gammaproteobacteria bacterium]
MAKAVRIHQPGGPEELRYETVDVPAPGAGEVRLRQTAVGLNYIDVYHRTGLYPIAELPAAIGLEAAGVIEELGEGVSDFAVGDRVAYANPPLGAYADERVIPAHRLVRLPDDIDDRTAAAMMLQGMTVQYLLRRTYAVQPGDRVLLHAAAGGVGLIACQWLNHLGAETIGTVGSSEKAEMARAHGCHHTIDYRSENFVERVREITGGKGVRVVYDSIGRDTFNDSLDCLQPLGMMVSFGNATGAVENFNVGTLAQKGSLFLTRPTLMTYTAKREDMLAMAGDLFDVVRSGAVKIEINQAYALADAADAHRDLEARRTTGSSILLP